MSRQRRGENFAYEPTSIRAPASTAANALKWGPAAVQISLRQRWRVSLPSSVLRKALLLAASTLEYLIVSPCLSMRAQRSTLTWILATSPSLLIMMSSGRRWDPRPLAPSRKKVVSASLPVAGPFQSTLWNCLGSGNVSAICLG